VSRPSGMRGLGAAAAGLGVLLLAAGLTLGGTARASSPGASGAAGEPPPTSAQAVSSALGIDSNPPAELVFLVDRSDSMGARGGLYPAVEEQLPAYLQTLASEEPNDQVAVITFGQPGTTQVIYGPGPPTPDIGLPTTAHDGTTDFGQAFAEAIDLLAQRPAGIKVGGVVLLSDGGLDAPADPLYDGGQKYNAPGWNQLHSRAAGLPIPVTGYAVPLTRNPKYVADQKEALSKVFAQVRTLPGGSASLASSLSVAGQQVVYGEVYKKVAPDSGRGVQVTWSGLPSTPLDFRSAGHLDVTVTLTSLAERVPLYVTGLRVSSPGTPVTITATLPETRSFGRGHDSATYPVRLTWQRETIGSSFTGGERKTTGRLILAGVVGSTWTQPLQSTFAYASFSAGALHGNVVTFGQVAASASELKYLLIPGCILAALILAGLLRMLLFGSLTFTAVNQSQGRLLLPPAPVLVWGTRRLIDRGGMVIVRGSPFRGRMKVSLRLSGKPRATVRLERGGQTMAAGIHIVHSRLLRRSRQNYPRYRRR
jgi:hypothetical protein